MASIIPNLTKTIQSIAEVAFLQFIKNKIILENGDTANSYYMAETFCNGHGNYVAPESCDCDIGFFGTYCMFNGYLLWGGGWTFIQVLVAFIYTIVAIITWIYFIRTITSVINFLLINRNSEASVK
jgi:hypothetical protein